MSLGKEYAALTALTENLTKAVHATPGSVKASCELAQLVLSNSRDNLRGFFQQAFPQLLGRVFGYTSGESGFLNLVNRPGWEADAKALIDLLAPSGALMQAVHKADSEKLVRYAARSARSCFS